MVKDKNSKADGLYKGGYKTQSYYILSTVRFLIETSKQVAVIRFKYRWGI